MSTESELIFFRKIFGEIISGYSRYYLDTEPPGSTESVEVFIKHLSPLDDLAVSYAYQSCFQELKSRGLFTEEEKIQYLNENNLWDTKIDQKIKDSRWMLKSYHENKRKAFKIKDINYYNEQIKNEEELLIKLITERSQTLGETVEAAAQKESDLFIVQNFLFKDSGATKFLHTPEEFRNLSTQEVDQLYRLYFKFRADISEENIKKLSINSIFTNLFFLTEHVNEFWGRAVVNLSHHQINLATYGRYFQSILTESGIPDEFKDDPQRLEDWSNGKRNVQEILDRTADQSGVVSIPLSPSEMKHYAIVAPIDYSKIQQRAGNTNGIEEAIRKGLLRE